MPSDAHPAPLIHRTARASFAWAGQDCEECRAGFLRRLRAQTTFQRWPACRGHFPDYRADHATSHSAHGRSRHGTAADLPFAAHLHSGKPLINLMLGLYLRPQKRWRHYVQIAGSIFLMLSPCFCRSHSSWNPEKISRNICGGVISAFMMRRTLSYTPESFPLQDVNL